ncbi:MAG: glucose-1-phosphate thymidylyltransferase [Parcubacteria group bacterium]|nr:glucose-1-phosphate thymidylyltransferase [Parcubacteria group bacterium]
MPNPDVRYIFSDFFQNIPEEFQELFLRSENLWDPIRRLDAYCGKNAASQKHDFGSNVFFDGFVSIGEGTAIEPGVVIKGPAIIGKNCEIRSGAYIRGNVVTGDDCVIGHGTEAIRSILMNGVRLDHFNYVGDSILGARVHFGAGAKVANLRFDEKNIVVDGTDTGMKKLGAIIGDEVQLGVNVTIGPGCVLLPQCRIVSTPIIASKVFSKKDFFYRNPIH